MASPSAFQSFFSWCEKLGIQNQAGRHPALIAAVKEQVHESVLFFLCGQDYIYRPNDQKLLGIERLFIGVGTPYEINGGTGTIAAFRKALHAPAVSVKTEGFAAHSISAFTTNAGARAGGAANYNLAVNALSAAVYGMGPSTFLKDMVAGVNRGRTGPGQVGSLSRIVGYMQEMRTAATPYWGADLWHLGL